MPTAKDSVADKVGRLTTAQRSRLERPKEEDVVVFNIAKREGESKQLPWLTVYGDGRIKVEMQVVDFTTKRDDKISKDELDWLMHLAVNECKGLEQTTSKINANYKANRRSSNDNSLAFLYQVRTKDKQNTFEIPGEALTLRALRAELKLYPFASLHAFAKFISNRAFLGTEAQRKAVLDLMNAELKANHPDVPPFQLIHLLTAGESKQGLSVMFQQQVSLGENKFNQVTGTYMLLPNKKEPTMFVNAM